MVGPGGSLTSPLSDSITAPIDDHQRLDALERRILGLPPVHMPVEHLFTPGLYRRTISMPPGTLLTSKIHKTEHPYAVLRGRAFVLVLGQEPELLEAGHQGVTRPMTRRALYIPEDAGESCVWSTFHPLSTAEEEMRQNGASAQELLDMIEARIIEPRLHLDGSNAHQEYISALQVAGLPGPHDGPLDAEVYSLPHGDRGGYSKPAPKLPAPPAEPGGNKRCD